ncbi:MAG: hypothetical protein U0414_28900 [Polyangiaceae bacterium]
MRFAALAPILVVAALAHDARAELADDARAAADHLVAEGALVDRGTPRFLSAGEIAVLHPLDVVSSSDACVTLVLLASRGTQFVVTRSGLAPSPAAGGAPEATALIDASLHDPKALEASNEGLYVYTACGAGLSGMATVVVRMRSPRGALETIVARSPRAPSSVDELLLERSRGSSSPAPVAFDPIEAGPADDRKQRALERARARGATNVASVTMTSSSEGTGEFDLRVSRGCHAFDVVSEAPRADLDGVLKAGSGEKLAEDDAEAPDVHLETCLPEVDDLSLRFSGAEASTPVSVLDSLFAWPKWITDRWGIRAATALARVVFEGPRIPAPVSPPIAEVIGGPGTMVFHPAVEPGRCYLASLAITRGTSRGLRLSAAASSRTSVDQAGLPGDAVTVTFCSEDQDRARVQVEAPSISNAWVLSIHALGGGAEGGDAP